MCNFLKKATYARFHYPARPYCFRWGQKQPFHPQTGRSHTSHKTLLFVMRFHSL